MKFSAPQSAILAAAAACAEVTPAKPIVPSHACVVVDAANDRIALRSTNAYQSIEVTCAAVVDRPGRAVVSAVELRNRLKAASDSDVTVTLGESLAIRQGTLRFSIALFRDEVATPSFPAPSDSATIHPRALSSLLERAAVAASKDNTQPDICGVHLVGDGSRLTASATDRHMLARASVPFEGRLDCLVPLAAVGHIRKVLGADDADVRLSTSSSTLSVSGPSLTYSTVLAAATFPVGVVDMVLTTAGDRSRVDRAALTEAVRAVRAGDLRDGRLCIYKPGGTIVLRGKDEKGQPSQQCVSADGPFRTIAIVADWVAAGLAFFTGDVAAVDLWHRQGHGALLLTGNSGGDVFGILPMLEKADDLPVDATAEEEAA